MTNKDRQRSLDRKKWLASEKLKSDMSGEMPYCDFCEHQTELLWCLCNQEQRESNCLCATAYNRLVRAQQKNRLQPNGK